MRVRVQWRKVRDALEVGQPSAITLVHTEAQDDQKKKGHHTVLVYGATVSGAQVTMRVYDPNYPWGQQPTGTDGQPLDASHLTLSFSVQRTDQRLQLHWNMQGRQPVDCIVYMKYAPCDPQQLVRPRPRPDVPQAQPAVPQQQPAAAAYEDLPTAIFDSPGWQQLQATPADPPNGARNVAFYADEGVGVTQWLQGLGFAPQTPADHQVQLLPSGYPTHDPACPLSLWSFATNHFRGDVIHQVTELYRAGFARHIARMRQCAERDSYVVVRDSVTEQRPWLRLMKRLQVRVHIVARLPAGDPRAADGEFIAQLSRERDDASVDTPIWIVDGQQLRLSTEPGNVLLVQHLLERVDA